MVVGNSLRVSRGGDCECENGRYCSQCIRHVIGSLD
jgi:hypothetical protein